METTVGTPDRLVRLLRGVVVGLVGLAALAGALELAGPLGVAALLVGVILVETALTRTCLVYSVLGLNTCRR